MREDTEIIASAITITLITAGDIVFGACNDQPGEAYNDTLGLEFACVDIWWINCFHGVSYKALATQVEQGIAMRRQKGYEVIAFRLGEGTTDSLSLFTRNIFGYDELHPGSPNKYDTLAHRAMGAIMEYGMWPPYDTYGPDEPPDPMETYWAESCDSFMNYLRDTIHYFRIWNEPDAFRRHVLRDYHRVFVLNDTSTLGTLYYKHSTDSFKVVVFRNTDHKDSTRRASLTFRFYKWHPGEGWVADSVFQETVRVSQNLETWIKESAWTPAYFVNYFQKPAYLKAKAYNQNIQVVMVPRSFDLCGREKNYLYPWISDEQWPWPYIINNPDSPGLYQWADAFFDAGGADYCDILEYHTYVDWKIMNYPDLSEPYHTDPWETLPEVLQALIDVHQEHSIASRELWITEFGANSVTLLDTAPAESVRNRLKAEYLVHYYDVMRKFTSPDSFNLTVAQMYNYRERGVEWLIGDDFGLVGFSPTGPDTSVKYPEQAYMTMREYIKAYDQADTLLASRHSEATFGPGNKIDAAYTDQPPVRKYWVAFPFKQYDPAQKALVLKGIRVLRIDTLGNTDSVVNLTGSPYNKVDQLAIAGADNAPCIAFTTSDSGNIYYVYIGASVSRTLLWRNDTYRDSAYFPLLENEGNYIHLVFYGKSTKPDYGNGIHWMRFTYNDPGSPFVDTSIPYGEIPDWMSFDLNSDNKPWIVWEHRDSVYLVRHSGLAWDDFKTVASSCAKWPDISMKGPETAWVAWHKFSTDSIFVRGYTPYGLTSKFNGPVGRTKADSSFPQIDLLGTSVFVLWSDSNIVQVGEVFPNPNPYKPWSFDTRLAKGLQTPFGYSFTNALLESTPLHSLYPGIVARSATRIMTLWTEGEYDAHRVGYGLK